MGESAGTRARRRGAKGGGFAARTRAVLAALLAAVAALAVWAAALPAPQALADDGGDVMAVSWRTSGTSGTCTWMLDFYAGQLVIEPTDGKSGQLADVDKMGAAPWYAVRDYITSVTVRAGVKAGNNAGYLFYGCSNLASADLTNLDVSGASSTIGMFYRCSSLQSLDLSGWDTSSATNLNGMFRGCSPLSSLDLSSWDTSALSDGGTNSMLLGCASLRTLALGEGFSLSGDPSLPCSEGAGWLRAATAEMLTSAQLASYGGSLAGTWSRAASPSEPVRVPLGVVLEGRAAAEGEFSFEVVDGSGAVVATAVSHAAGAGDLDGLESSALSFSALDLIEGGEALAERDITLTVRQVGGGTSAAGVARDGSEHQVTVHLTGPGDGGRVVAEVVSEAPVFHNSYAAAAASYTPVGHLSTSALPETDLSGLSFSFTVREASGEPAAKGSSGANGDISFGSLSLASAGTHAFAVTQDVSGGQGQEGAPAGYGGVTYDTAAVTLTVEVADDGRGQLVVTGASYSTGDAAYFQNSYDGGAVSLPLSGSVDLSGRGLQAGEFCLRVVDDATGQEVAGGANAADGSVDLGALLYSYYVRDAEGGDASDEGDPTGDGLDQGASGDGASTDAQGSTGDANSDAGQGATDVGTPADGGTMGGRPAGGDGSDGPSQPDGGNAADGQPFDGSPDASQSGVDQGDPDAGQPEGDQGGVEAGTADASQAASGEDGFDAAVSSDGPDVALASDVPEAVQAAVDEPDQVTFESVVGESAQAVVQSAGASPASDGLAGAIAALAGPAVAVADDEGAVPFEADVPVLSEGGVTDAPVVLGAGVAYVPAATEASAADVPAVSEAGVAGVSVVSETGAYAAPAVSESGSSGDAPEAVSTDLGVHTYTVSQVVPADADWSDGAPVYRGVTYDTHTYSLTVEVRDNGDGTISASVASMVRSDGVPASALAFHNSYAPTGSAVAHVEGTVSLSGRDAADGEFAFTVADASGAVAATGVSTAAADGQSGAIAFGALTFDAPGSFDYTVSQVKGSAQGVAYDASSFAAHVEISDNGDGTLSAEVTYPGGAPAFLNSYAAPEPEPTPDPDPDPDPTPEPTPDPDPMPEPTPTPDPDPDPDPTPEPTPDPDPMPEPTPTPNPDPTPTPSPSPEPGPSPEPAPSAPKGPAAPSAPAPAQIARTADPADPQVPVVLAALGAACALAGAALLARRAARR